MHGSRHSQYHRSACAWIMTSSGWRLVSVSRQISCAMLHGTTWTQKIRWEAPWWCLADPLVFRSLRHLWRHVTGQSFSPFHLLSSEPRQGQRLREQKLSRPSSIARWISNLSSACIWDAGCLGDWGCSVHCWTGAKNDGGHGGSPRDGVPPSASLGGDPAWQRHCMPAEAPYWGCLLLRTDSN